MVPIARVDVAVSHAADLDPDFWHACIRMSVSIFTPKAFSMRSAVSPDRPALAVERTGRGGVGYPKRLGDVRNGQARGFDDFRPDEIAGVGWILHGHVYARRARQLSLALGQHTLAFERFVQQRLDVGLVWQSLSLGEALRQCDVGLRQSNR